ncbi:peptidoglycan-binding protein [Sorangium sp. So ce542]|uniref:peptidoglycan-binding protein n=1 Tax=Sorangium sp. So ce542 TaxID=3133316 RepID=UPI003F63D16D
MTDKQVSVATGKQHRFILAPKLECSELPGPHFDFDSTFIRPEGMAALGAIADTLRRKRDKRAAIFGHTDTVGDEAYNKTLSEERARVVLAALTHDPAPWEDRYQAERWGVRVVQAMLNDVQPREDRSPRLAEDGVAGPLTRASIRRFQERAGLDQDGDAGPATRKELFLAYMKRSVEEPADPGQLVDIGGAKYMGCGEYNPFTERSADDASRRVVVILFSPATAPSGLPCAIGDTGPCQPNLRGKDAPPAPADKTPHFRCNVYRGIAERCPCGPGAELMSFRVQLHDEIYAPCGGVAYRLTLPSGSVIHGEADASGWLRNAVPKGRQVVLVTYTPEGYDHEISLRVRLTDADPASDDAMLCHLFNFGFAHDDGSDRGMILRFQAAKGLALTGEIDDPTRAAVRQIVEGDDGSMRECLREDAA